jgi:hypothetical protein
MKSVFAAMIGTWASSRENFDMPPSCPSAVSTPEAATAEKT